MNEAIGELFSDTSVDQETTLADFELIIEDLQIRCDGLRSEIEEK